MSPCLPSQSWAKAGACVTLPAKPELGEGWSLCHPERSRRVKSEGFTMTISFKSKLISRIKAYKGDVYYSQL
jgi:hypothetical protein